MSDGPVSRDTGPHSYYATVNMSPYISQLLTKYPIISDQVDRAELTVLLTALEQQLRRNSTGSIVEFGCYIGTTSLFIRRLLDHYASLLEYHVYDSFEGLPEKATHDQSPAGIQFVAGALAVSKKEFLLQFKKAHLRPPVIHKGWFSDLTLEDIPHDIQFAFLDGDYYESIRDSLARITPRLTPGAIVIVDDYANEALPGAARATDEWLRDFGVQMRVAHSLAIITT